MKRGYGNHFLNTSRFPLTMPNLGMLLVRLEDDERLFEQRPDLAVLDIGNEGVFNETVTLYVEP